MLDDYIYIYTGLLSSGLLSDRPTSGGLMCNVLLIKKMSN